TLAGSGIINMSGGGRVQLLAQDATNGKVTFASGSAQTVQGGGAIYISSPGLVLSTGTPLSATGASAISVDSGTGNAGLSITAPAGSTTISTTGGSYLLVPTTNFNLAFTGGTLNLSGGAITATTSTGSSGGISIASGTTVAS